MHVFGEAIHYGENHQFPADLGESYNEIQGDVLPDRRGHRQRLEQPRRVQMLCFVALADGATLDMIPDQAVGIGIVERRS